jgi:hypothetical protein
MERQRNPEHQLVDADAPGLRAVGAPSGLRLLFSQIVFCHHANDHILSVEGFLISSSQLCYQFFTITSDFAIGDP